MLEALFVVSGAAWALYGRLMEVCGEEGPAESVRLFHRADAERRLGEIGNLFSLACAYQYWQDVTAAFGIACPSEEVFKRQLMAYFRAAQTEASSYTPNRISMKIISQVASVVFERAGEEVSASVVREGDRWKVRTCPGIFPGAMLSRARGQAGRQGEGVGEK